MADSKRDQRKRSGTTEWWWEDLPSHPIGGWQSAIRAAQTDDEDIIGRLPAFGVAPGVF